MKKNNSLMFKVMIILMAFAFAGVLFFPSDIKRISQNINETTILTTAAIIILAFMGLRFIVRKLYTIPKKVYSILLMATAIGYLTWTHAISTLVPWFQEHLILTIIICTALITGLILGCKALLHRFARRNKNQKKDRIPIPIEIQRQVISRANYRCQWKSCPITGNLEIHHIDNDPANNGLYNLIYLCPNHHQAAQRNEARSWLLRDWTSGRY